MKNKWLYTTTVFLGISLCALLLTEHSKAVNNSSLNTNFIKASEASPAVDPSIVPARKLEDAVNAWIGELSKQQEFETWQQAQWTSYPLGPGTHGWVVLLNKDGKEVGYLIVQSSPEGEYQLTEYGSGGYPLFSLNTLYQTMIRQELIPDPMSFDAFTNDENYKKARIYANPLLALWQISWKDQVWIIEAKTGELYPLTEEDMKRMKHDDDDSGKSHPDEGSVSKLQPAVIDRSLQNLAFDPYERINWVNKPSLSIKDFTDLEKLLLNRIRITFTAELVDQTILVPLPIIGFHHWDDDSVYVLGDQEGSRYIPFSQLAKLGTFYR